MVMDATQPQPPSPQSVGREFVRQYYTLLNKAPNHLHRFYNNNSSFIHGESSLVVGQKNIHNKIQQLNFHDCHAKISQVDAQATLGNGVVVQVTGELSNDGQPMRRFTQTFVLASQSPKKYYVHNDIFRYQDLYSDEENDGESRSENDEEHEQTVPAVGSEQQSQIATAGVISVAAVAAEQQQLPAQVVVSGAAGVLPPQQQAPANASQQQTIFYSLPTTGGRPVTVLTPQGTAVPLGAQFATAAAAATGVLPQQVQAAAVTQLNGVVTHDDMLGSMQQTSVAGQQALASQTNTPVVPQQATVPVAAAVLAQTGAGVTAVAVVPTTTIQQNVPGAITGFQQSQLMQQQIIQQQSLPNATPQLLQTQAPQTNTVIANVDVDEVISTTNAVNISNTSSSEHSLRNVSTAPNSIVSGHSPDTTTSPIVDDFKTINEQQQQEKYEAAKQQHEPKTYANLFKSTSSSPSGFVNAAMQQQQQLQQHQQSNNAYHSSSTISTTTFSQSNSTSSMSAYNNRNSDNSLRLDNNNMGPASQGPLPQRSNATRINKEYEPRRTSNPQQFGDNQQLFLGNIPHHASEEELKSLFSRFGTVVELRILSKPGGKLPPGMRNPLNYGFITYDDPESVQNCLSNCPLYFPENSPDGQKLNVEEKKPRVRQNDMPPRQSMGGGSSGLNNNGNMNNSQRGQMSGGPPSRSLSNSGGGNIMRGSNTSGNSMSRGSTGGSGRPQIGGAFNRNENRSGGPSNGGGPQVRGNNNPQSGGGSYSNRR